MPRAVLMDLGEEEKLEKSKGKRIRASESAKERAREPCFFFKTLSLDGEKAAGAVDNDDQVPSMREGQLLALWPSEWLALHVGAFFTTLSRVPAL